MPTTEIKVNSISEIKRVAGSIAHELRNTGVAYVQAAGPVAVNNAVKAIIVARQYLLSEGSTLVMFPDFKKALVPETGETRHFIQFLLERERV